MVHCKRWRIWVLLTGLAAGLLSGPAVPLAAEGPAQTSSGPAETPSATGPAPSEAGPAIMPVAEVSPGMKGYGLTALRGVQPERFDVEVLGVLRGAFAKGDIILIRMSSPAVDQTGVIAGMSGSPVYIDGKLLGAVAYGWRFCKVPLAGVTPAQEMMQVWRIDGKASAQDQAAAKAAALEALRARSRDLSRLLTSGALTPELRAQARRAMARMATPASFGSAVQTDEMMAFPPAVRDLLPEGVGPAIQPLPIPLSIRGARSSGSSLIPLLDSAGFMAVEAAGRAQDPAVADVKLEAGMPVGPALVTGDMDISGMGTLTWTDGRRAAAFGHAMFGSGETNLPLAVGDVQAVVPSLYNSFKLTNAGKVIGRITQDRSSAILGHIGQEAATFPCKVRVSGAVNEEFNFRIAGYWDVAPMLADMTIAESSARWEGEGARYTLNATARIALRGHKEPLVLQNVYASYGVLSPGFDLVVMPMETLLLNPYREVEIESLTYELEVRPGFQVALIESAWADRTKATPGSEVSIYVRLLPYRGDQVVQRLKFRMPDTAKPDTRVTILLCDATINRMVKQSLDPGLFGPRTLEGILAALREDMDSNKLLIMRASVVEQGVRYDGGAMPALPPSVLNMLEYNEAAGQSLPLVTDIVRKVETPWVLEGSQSVSVLVDRPDTHRP